MRGNGCGHVQYVCIVEVDSFGWGEDGGCVLTPFLVEIVLPNRVLSAWYRCM